MASKESTQPHVVSVPQIHDVEDMCSFGRSYKVCPFYTARHIVEYADLVIVPYQYVINPKIRRAVSIDIAGNIFLFDEAHNIED